jgi:hypothetical protein
VPLLRKLLSAFCGSTKVNQARLTASSGFGAMSKRDKSALGVLLTGYLEKANPDAFNKQPKKRFVVLTHVGLHWFKRTEGYGTPLP